VGAGAVVVTDVPDYALMLGVPAKRKGWVCKCGTTLKDAKDGQEIVCPECGSRYQPQGEVLGVIEEKI
jgi:UDP-2-acetamido-3-amino-2,3-dideoxy-glucuronate N-acetyltransferase